VIDDSTPSGAARRCSCARRGRCAAREDGFDASQRSATIARRSSSSHHDAAPRRLPDLRALQAEPHVQVHAGHHVSSMDGVFDRASGASRLRPLPDEALHQEGLIRRSSNTRAPRRFVKKTYTQTTWPSRISWSSTTRDRPPAPLRHAHEKRLSRRHAENAEDAWRREAAETDSCDGRRHARAERLQATRMLTRDDATKHIPVISAPRRARNGQGLGLARARGLRGEADQRHRLLAKFPPRMSHRQDFPAEYRAICPRARESGKPPDDLQARHTRRRACLLSTSPMRGNSLPCHVLPWPRCGQGFERGERARRALLRGGLLRFHRQEARTRITLALC